MDDADIKEVTKYVKENRVKARKGFVCVDGRYKPNDDTSGMLARPGGNFRGIMVLLALKDQLNMTVGRIVDRAVDAVEEMGITFNMHTDEHEDPDDLASIGCGHIAKAANPQTAPTYKVDPMDIKKALIYLKIKLEGKKYYKMVKLAGQHAEKGVLVISGKKYTVNHSDERSSPSDKNGSMYFVFDKARDDKYLKKLYDHLNVSNKLSYKKFQEYSDLQLKATLNNLAKGLPIYRINVDGEEPEVEFLGNV